MGAIEVVANSPNNPEHQCCVIANHKFTAVSGEPEHAVKSPPLCRTFPALSIALARLEYLIAETFAYTIKIISPYKVGQKTVLVISMEKRRHRILSRPDTGIRELMLKPRTSLIQRN